jgi:hypothetical protein
MDVRIPGFPVFLAFCRNGNEQSVRTPLMKIVSMNSEGTPPQGSSRARRGSLVFSYILPVFDPLRGCPVGGGGVHHK